MNEDIQRTVTSAVTTEGIPRTIAHIVSEDEPRQANSSEAMDALYEGYQIDRKIPWGRYIFIYLVLIFVIAGSAYFALSNLPRKLNNPFVNAIVIDKMDYFTDTSAVQAELEKLQKKSGAYFAVAALTEEERDALIGDSAYKTTRIYPHYFDDEDHVLILVTKVIVSDDSHTYRVEVESGNNAVSIVKNVPIAKTIKQWMFSENDDTKAFVAGLRDVNPLLMKVGSEFWRYAFAAVAATVVLFVHCYKNIIKRRRFEKAERTAVAE